MTNPIRFQTETDPLTTLKVPKPVDVVQVQSTATTIYTARDDADFQIESLVATNTTGTADYVTVYLVPSGGSAGATNMIVYQRAIPAKGGIAIFDQFNQCLLQPGSFIQALCSTNDAVNMWGYGFDYQGQYS